MHKMPVTISSLLLILYISSSQSSPVSSDDDQIAIAWNGNDHATSCDFLGNDLSNSKTNSDKCYSLCVSTSGCTHFTWSGWNGGTCWMKKGIVSPDDAVATSDPGMLCGYVTHSNNIPTSSQPTEPTHSEKNNSDELPPTTSPRPVTGNPVTIAWNGNDHATYCDFLGNDLSNSKTNSDKCYSLCASTSGCTHFTWTGFNGGTCWMKNGPVSPDDATATSDPGMLCGYITHSNIQPNSQPTEPTHSENNSSEEPPPTNSHRPQTINTFYICPS